MNSIDDQPAWIDDDTVAARARDVPGATRGALLLLMVGWTAVAAVALLLTDGMVARFLDMPLAFYLAGQGVLMALVIVSVRIVQLRNG